MSDILTIPKSISHITSATQEIVEEFRDVLARHTAKLPQEEIEHGGQAGSPQEAAELHRLSIGCDNFLNVLVGNF